MANLLKIPLLIMLWAASVSVSAQLFDRADPFQESCNPQNQSYNECERQRIVAMRNIQAQRAGALPYPKPFLIPKQPVRCNGNLPQFEACEQARQSYIRALQTVANSQTDRARQMQRDLTQKMQRNEDRRQTQQDMRDAVREGTRDSKRGYGY